MRILLADDQPKVCSALRLLLEQEADTTVTVEAGNSKELLAAVERDCPDLLLLDWELPGGKGAELIPALRARCPELVIIALSSRPETRQMALNTKDWEGKPNISTSHPLAQTFLEASSACVASKNSP